MFRLIIFTCFLHFSVGGIIRGRVLFDGDENKFTRVPMGSHLIVRLQDTSMADAAAIVLKQTRVSNLFAFPFNYQIEIPNNVSPATSYSLSARITKGDTLLYTNDQHIPVTIGNDSPIIIDISVIRVNQDLIDNDEQTFLNDMEQLSWPEMVGKEGTYAVEYIKEKSGLTNVFTVSENSPITMDYRTDRVRVFVNEKGIVTQVPRTG